MNCLEFRQLKLSDPYCISEEADLHQSGCSNCARFEREIRGLDDSIRTALTVAVPEGFAAKVLLNQSLQSHPRRPKRWYWLSLAASFLLAVIVYQFLPRETLADDIFSHMEYEQVHDLPGDISEDEVRKVLYSVRGDADTTLGKVTFASVCFVNDRLAAHFVVEDGDERYTLMIIPKEIDRQQPFQNDRWRGVIIPHPTGSLAIISGVQSEFTPDLLRVAERYGDSIKRITI